jgi:hypothetical protein
MRDGRIAREYVRPETQRSDAAQTAAQRVEAQGSEVVR